MATVVVFTDTNLGTRLAIAVPPDITAGDFESEFERSHFDCFPIFGDIKVSGVTVKGKSRFYHLPNSMPIKHAFHNSQSQWFLHVEAKPLTGLFNYSAAEVGINNCDTRNITHYLEPRKCITSADNNIMKCKGRRRKVSRFHCLKGVHQLLRIVYISKKNKEIKKKKEKIGKRKKIPRKRLTRNHFTDCTEQGIENGNGSKNEDTFNERLSDEVSVTGIIRRYFTNLNEVSPSSSDVTSKTIKKQTEEPFDSHPKTPSRIISPSTGFNRDNLEKFDVGNRLVNASTNLVVSVCKPWPAFSLCRFKVPNSSSPMVRSLSVFEISDNDD